MPPSNFWQLQHLEDEEYLDPFHVLPLPSPQNRLFINTLDLQNVKQLFLFPSRKKKKKKKEGIDAWTSLVLFQDLNLSLL